MILHVPLGSGGYLFRRHVVEDGTPPFGVIGTILVHDEYEAFRTYGTQSIHQSLHTDGFDLNVSNVLHDYTSSVMN